AAFLVRMTDLLLLRTLGGFRAAGLFLAVAAILYPQHRREGGFTKKVAAQSGEELRPVAAALHSVRPSFPPGARMLFLNDPIRPDVHDLLFLIRLSYHDRSLMVD